MNTYIYIHAGEVTSFVAEWDPTFPNIPIEKRYSKSFLNSCVIRTEQEIEEQGIHVGMLYDRDTDTFSEKPEPEAPPEPVEPIVPEFTVTQVEVDEAYRGGVNHVE